MSSPPAKLTSTPTARNCGSSSRHHSPAPKSTSAAKRAAAGDRIHATAMRLEPTAAVESHARGSRTRNAPRSRVGASATRKPPKIVSTSASGALAVSHPQLGPEGDHYFDTNGSSDRGGADTPEQHH